MNKLKTLLLLAIVSISTYANGQTAESDTTKYWNLRGVGNLNFSQVALSNWQAGGENSLSAIFLFKYFADYKKDKIAWDNYIDIAYGITQQGDIDLAKTDDRLELYSSLGYQLNDKWDANAFLTFRTQFTDGYASLEQIDKISGFMAPGYLIPGLGFNYKPNEHISVNLSPVTGKWTFVQDDSLSAAGAFGVDPGETSRTELGAYAKVIIKKSLVENVALETKADFFTNYLENFGSIDVTWDLAILMKVNDWLSASITTNLIYDEDIQIAVEEDDQGNVTKTGPRVQFKEVFGLGLTVKL